MKKRTSTKNVKKILFVVFVHSGRTKVHKIITLGPIPFLSGRTKVVEHPVPHLGYSDSAAVG